MTLDQAQRGRDDPVGCGEDAHDVFGGGEANSSGCRAQHCGGGGRRSILHGSGAAFVVERNPLGDILLLL